VSAAEETSGYCRQCGGYGQGRFVEVISEYSDAIDRCRPCVRRAGAPSSGVDGGRADWAPGAQVRPVRDGYEARRV